jgi:hypothetical protein
MLFSKEKKIGRSGHRTWYLTEAPAAMPFLSSRGPVPGKNEPSFAQPEA